jgi:threonine aldolase
MQEAAKVGRSLGLSMHLDGARLWNAAAATATDVAEFAAPFDSVSVCLSKGLGAPMGSVLVGSAELIHEAHKWRKMLGGALRQVGLVAAAGQYALDHHRDRLVDDHANAVALAQGLAEIDGVTIAGQNTNMVFAHFAVADDQAFVAQLAEEDVQVLLHAGACRMVTHLDVSAEDIERVVHSIGKALHL